MSSANSPRVGYVLKRYPRYSETFIVNEILAHEAAGLALEIFSLRNPDDRYFQEAIARVRTPVTYLPLTQRAADLWSAIQQASAILPDLWGGLESGRGEDARDVCQAVVLASEVRRRGIDHLHAHFASSATTVARLAARMAGVPFTFTAHAKDIYHQSVRADDLRRKLAEAAGVVTVSDFNREHLTRLHDSPTPIRRIYNGLDLEQFPYVGPRDRPARIVAVGRLVEKKGFDDLVTACAILADQDRPFECTIIGAGPLEDPLRAQIDRLGLRDRVELAGPRPQGIVAREVQRAAAFVAPCIVSSDGDRDGLPTVLLEAMALGTPSISTDVTGIPEVLRDQETGLLVPQRDPAGLAAAIGQLLTDAALRARLAARARQLIEAEFDIHRNAAGLRALFRTAESLRAEAA